MNVTDCPYTDGFTLDVTTVPAVALVTVCPLAKVPVLVPKLLLPEYTAVTAWFPTVSVLVLPEVATPDTSVTGKPKFVPSIVNCTVPPGVPEPDPDAATLAVKLTACPYTDGFNVEPTVVLLVAWFTTCPPLSVPVLPWWLLSPL